MADTASQIKIEHPAKKKKLHFATWIALASALAAIIAAFVSASSVNVAEEQNTAAEQQQLVNITVAIEQTFIGEAAAETEAAGNLTGTARSAAVASAQQQVIAEATADAQAGAVIINDLHGDGVAGIEYVEVARALANYGDTAEAITYYNDAVNAPPHDVPTRANALRNVAGLYYSIGQDAIGHQDMIAAAKIYGGHPELTQSLIDNSIAQAYLADAGYQVLANGCHTAATDLADAERALSPLGINGANLTDQALEGTVVAAYKKKCIA